MRQQLSKSSVVTASNAGDTRTSCHREDQPITTLLVAHGIADSTGGKGLSLETICMYTSTWRSSIPCRMACGTAAVPRRLEQAGVYTCTWKSSLPCRMACGLAAVPQCASRHAAQVASEPRDNGYVYVHTQEKHTFPRRASRDAEQEASRFDTTGTYTRAHRSSVPCRTACGTAAVPPRASRR